MKIDDYFLKLLNNSTFSSSINVVVESLESSPVLPLLIEHLLFSWQGSGLIAEARLVTARRDHSHLNKSDSSD